MRTFNQGGAGRGVLVGVGVNVNVGVGVRKGVRETVKGGGWRQKKLGWGRCEGNNRWHRR